MKKIFLVTLLAVLSLTAACGKGDKTGAQTSASDAVSSAAAQSDSTNMERLDGSAVSGKAVDEGVKEKAFVGGWRSVSTTSDNAEFTFLELQITEDNYIVTLTFDDGSATSYKGSYEVHDGVLKFDDSFIGCTAYFYDDDAATLVVDNGNSLVLCKHLETEEEMKATKRSGK